MNLDQVDKLLIRYSIHEQLFIYARSKLGNARYRGLEDAYRKKYMKNTFCMSIEHCFLGKKNMAVEVAALPSTIETSS